MKVEAEIAVTQLQTKGRYGVLAVTRGCKTQGGACRGRTVLPTPCLWTPGLHSCARVKSCWLSFLPHSDVLWRPQETLPPCPGWQLPGWGHVRAKTNSVKFLALKLGDEVQE